MRGMSSKREDGGDAQSYQLGRQRGQTLVGPLRRTIFDPDVLTFDVTLLSQPLQECGAEERR